MAIPTLENGFFTRIFGSGETLLSFDTYQFKDYSKVVATRFNPEEKLKRRKEVFPKDCQKAFEMGACFAKRNGFMDLRSLKS